MGKQRAALAMLSAIGVFAQGNGSAGINEATQMVTSYFDPATQLIYAIGAVVGLTGGVKAYNKFSSGETDTSKTAGVYILDCCSYHPAFILPLILCLTNSYNINTRKAFSHSL